MLAYPTGSETVLAVAGVDACTIDVDLRLLRGIDGRHDDVGHEALAGVERRLLGYDEGLELVDADILHIDIRHQRVEHLALGVAHVVLQLRQQRHGCGHGHVLKHILLPVLAKVVLMVGHLGREVAGDDGALVRVGDKGEDALAVGVDGIVELAALACQRREHHGAGSVDVVGIVDIVKVSLRPVGFLDDGHLQGFGKVVERVAHLAHLRGLLKPLAHLLGIGGHLVPEGTVEGFVLR